MELAGAGVSLTFPTRWVISGGQAEPEEELNRLCEILIKGADAIAGTYMRMCDLIRSSNVSDKRARGILSAYFPDSRVSEIIRVSRAPDEVYRRYTTGFFGFKAALREVRGYQITPTEELNRRKARRAAQRLTELLPVGTIRINNRIVTVSMETIQSPTI